MEIVTQLEAQVLPVTKLVVKDGDKATEYQLVLDYNAIAKAQKEIGRDLSVILNWRNLNGTDLSAICWAAFDRYHGEVTLREVRQWLAPAQNAALFHMLFEAAYPGVLEEMIKKAQDSVPDTSPNVDAAASA